MNTNNNSAGAVDVQPQNNPAYIVKDDLIYATKPRIRHEKDVNGNWRAVQDGVETDGIPLARLIHKERSRVTNLLSLLGLEALRHD